MPKEIDNLLERIEIFAHQAHISLETRADMRDDYYRMRASHLTPAFAEFLDVFHPITSEVMTWIHTNETIMSRLKNATAERHIGQRYFFHLSDDKQNVYCIAPTQPPEYGWETIAVLIGNGEIPNMQVLKRPMNYDYVEHDLYPQNLGRFSFLAQFFKEKMIRASTPEVIDFTKQFIRANQEILDKIGSQCQMEPRVLGAGVDGVACQIGENRVLKIFTSSAAYDAALDAMRKLWHNPEAAAREAMIYEVGEFLPVKNRKLYYYIMEKMQPLEKLIDRDFLHQFLMPIRILLSEEMSNPHSDLRRWRTEIRNQANITDVRKQIKHRARDIEKNIDPTMLKRLKHALQDRVYLTPNWLNKLIEEMIWKFVTNRTDLHSGNIGATPYGQLRFFDPIF